MTFSRLVLQAGITMLAAMIAFSVGAVGITQGLLLQGVQQQIAALLGLVFGIALGVWAWKVVDRLFSSQRSP